MKKTIFLFLAFVVMFLLTACSGVSETSGRTVIDATGNAVAIPAGSIRAAGSTGGITCQVVMLAGAESVAIAPASFKGARTERFSELMEGTDDIPVADGDEISVEALLAAGVNVFFVSGREEKEIYSNAGIACLTVDYDETENLADSFVMIGEVFGGDALKRGKKIHDYMLQCVETAKSYSAMKKDRPSIYCIAAATQSAPYVTQGEETFVNKLFTMCGAEQVTPGTGTYITASAEYIMDADPDYILIDGYLIDEALQELIGDPVLKNLDAVKNNRIIIAPIGILRPCMKPGAETGIGILWLLKTICPEETETLNIEESAAGFYADCFGWDVKIDEVRAMLEGNQ